MGPSIEDKGYRTVIYQVHLHIGAEAATLHQRVAQTRGCHHPVEQRFALLRIRARGKTGPTTLAGIGYQRKLRHQQQTALHINQRQVHLAGAVGEYAIVEQAMLLPFDYAGVVAGLQADQYQQALFDLRDGLVRHHDAGSTDALQQVDQVTMSSIELQQLTRAREMPCSVTA